MHLIAQVLQRGGLLNLNVLLLTIVKLGVLLLLLLIDGTGQGSEESAEPGLFFRLHRSAGTTGQQKDCGHD
ncbi:hypothetical protein D3C76_1822240 [compost metagenome]